jgi:hypothetical protein
MVFTSYIFVFYFLPIVLAIYYLIVWLRPVVVKEWDGDFRAFSYVFKPHFARRISIARATRFNPRTNGTRSCQATTYDRLRVSERIELALFLDAIGLGGRLLFRNVRLYGTAKSVRLQLTTG